MIIFTRSKIRKNKFSLRVYVMANVPFLLFVFFFLLIGRNVFAQSGDLDQCRNGSASIPISPIEWVNGNAGSSNAHYAECNSVPYRMVITGLLPGTHTVDIGWDIKSGGSNAIDFITHYNRLLPHSQFNHQPEVVNPLIGLSGINSIPIYYPIPVPLSNMVVSCTGLPEPLHGFNLLPANER